MNKTFTLYWLDGKREFVHGETIADAFTAAGYGAGARHALDWYDQGASETDVYSKDEKRWIRRNPVNVHIGDVADLTQDEIVRLLKTASEIRIELRDGNYLHARQTYGRFARIGWIKYLEVYYAAHIPDYGEEGTVNVHGPTYFNHDDYANFIDHLKARVVQAIDDSAKAAIGGWAEGAKNMDEIKASQDTIPL